MYLLHNPTLTPSLYHPDFQLGRRVRGDLKCSNLSQQDQTLLLGGGLLFLSICSHLTCLHLPQVTKEGTEGAAATGVEIALFSAAFGEQIDIVVNRPFIFVVQDRKNKIPVLVGKITDPTKI